MINKMDKIFSQINPGDVIAFSGNGLDSRIIRWFTRSPYSHVGIVLDNKYPNKQGEDILIAESTTYTIVPDYQEQKSLKGVQVHWLSHRLDFYKACGRAWWFPLEQKLSHDSLSQMQSWLWHLYESQTPFSPRKSIGAWLARNKYFDTEKNKKISKNSAGLFCSELVAEALQIAGIIDSKLNPAAHTPRDVMNFECFREPTLLLP
ncbi:MAG: hypothetical protein F6K31_32135 [Symploca sp. SIO2G7]|nr:hypothetical protein [Symploca sp. SIO2G7]